MPASHSVGSLFVNISGSSKGLKRALSGAKKDLAGFQQSAGGLFGSGRVRQAQAAMSRANERRRALQGYLEMGGPGVKSSGPEFAKEMKRVLEEQGQARTELNAAQTAMDMRIGFAAMGLSIAAASTMIRGALNMGRTSVQQHMQFGAIGPHGADFIRAQIETLLNKIRHAQTPEGSLMTAREAEREKVNQELNRGMERLSDTFSEAVLTMKMLFTDPSVLFDPTQTALKRAAQRRAAGVAGPGVG